MTLNYRPFIVRDPELHTMEYALFRYLDIKIHPLVDRNEYKHIRVIGQYDRSVGISSKEKQDKIENWQRPTAEIIGDELIVRCFPGRDYVTHYASLVATYLGMKGRDASVVDCEIPDERACWKPIEGSRMREVKPVDYLITGAGLREIGGPEGWSDMGSFLHKQVRISTAKVAFLIVKHSFWGDIAGRLLVYLARHGFKRFIFVGKLGGIKPYLVPNCSLATGESSTMNGSEIRWENLFNDVKAENLYGGRHICVPSVLMETKEWLSSTGSQYDFVDPEIGHFARCAGEEKVCFSYLHIVSDNLHKVHRENLSNERILGIPEKRRQLFRQIGKHIANCL